MLLSEMLKKANCKAEILRDGEFELQENCTRVRAENALTYLENEKFISTLENPNISCVICKPEMAKQIPGHIRGIAAAPCPKAIFYRLQDYRVDLREKVPTVIDPTAVISPQAYVAPWNVVIGRNVRVDPLAVICENTTVEENVRICSGTVVGGQSFTAVEDDCSKEVFLARDAGRTLICKGVEICCNSHIACGTLEKDVTTLGPYSKLDALVHIGHGAVLGSYSLILSGANIAGNCIVGDHVWIGVNATVSNRIAVGDHARISLGSVVTKDVPAGETVTGNFAIPHKVFMTHLKDSVKESS